MSTIKRKRDIVIFGMTTAVDMAAGVSNRNIQVLYALLKRNDVGKVLFVDFIPFTPKMSLKTMLRSKTLTHRARIQKVTARMDPMLKDRSFHVLSIAHASNVERVVWKEVLRLGMQDAVGISYHPLYAEVFFSMPFPMHVFDAVDDWRAHPSYANLQEPLTEAYDEIDHKASLIFTVSEGLSSIFPTSQNVHWIPNGVNTELVHILQNSPPPRWIERLPRPIYGYNGVIQGRVETAMLEALASDAPNASILLIGPVWPLHFRSIRKKDLEIESLRRFSNIHFVGFRPHVETLRAILCYDVALIPHRASTLTKSMDPMKLYEYLACGKPIVSTPVSGVERFLSHVTIAETPENFSRAVIRVGASNSDGKRVERMKAVEACSWSARVEEMMRKIYNTASSAA